MRKLHLHLITLSMLLMLACPILFGFESKAAGWFTANGSRVIENTEIYSYVSYGTLFVCGTGEIPDYTPETLSLRPWHDQSFYRVIISPGITRVGKYAFYGKSELKTICISSTIFFADATCFQNVNKDTLIDISGKTRSYKDINGIMYDSFQSITAGAPNGLECVFLIDDDNTAWSFRENRYPYIPYVYSKTWNNNPWETKEPIFSGDGYSPIAQLKCRTRFEEFLTAYKRPMDENFITAFSILKGDNTYVCTFDMTMYDNGKVISNLTTPTQFVLNIPTLEQVPGRVYSLIAISKDGTVSILSDLDNDDKTITYETSKPTSFCALIYH